MTGLNETSQAFSLLPGLYMLEALASLVSFNQRFAASKMCQLPACRAMSIIPEQFTVKVQRLAQIHHISDGAKHN